MVSVAQLAALGVSREAVRHRVEHGRMAPIHRGVYLVGPLTDSLTTVMAAVLACGPTAVLSHRAAAALHGFAPEWHGDIDVTVTGGQPRRRSGIRVRRSPVPRDERTERKGIPVTSPARTIRDLAGEVGRRELERALEEALLRGALDHPSLTRAVQRATGRPGARALRTAAERATREPALTRSEAEWRLLEVVREAGLPAPRTNARVAGYEVDFLWRDARLVVEVDGFAFHGSRTAFERDRRKQADLVARGFRVARVTWRQLDSEPLGVAARLAAALAGGGAAAA